MGKEQMGVFSLLSLPLLLLDSCAAGHMLEIISSVWTSGEGKAEREREVAREERGRLVQAMSFHLLLLFLPPFCCLLAHPGLVLTPAVPLKAAAIRSLALVSV